MSRCTFSVSAVDGIGLLWSVLLKPNIRAKVYPAFAALDNNGSARMDAMYKQWVGKLDTGEYADELVLLVVALELPVRLVVILCIPQSSPTRLVRRGSAMSD